MYMCYPILIDEYLYTDFLYIFACRFMHDLETPRILNWKTKSMEASVEKRPFNYEGIIIYYVGKA